MQKTSFKQSGLLQLIEEDFDNIPAYQNSYPLPVIQGNLIKHSLSKKKDSPFFYYAFYPNDKKHSIRCIFNDPEQPEALLDMDIDDNPFNVIHSITVSKYFFDFLVRVKNERELEYNIVLFIREFTINEAQSSIEDDNEEKGEDDDRPMQLPPNINEDNHHLYQQSKDIYSHLIQKVFQHYNQKHPIPEYSSINFIEKSFGTQMESKKKITLIDMIREVYNISANYDGVLLREKKGIEDSVKYIFDLDYEVNEYLITSVDWKEMMLNSVTIKDKCKTDPMNAFVPSKLSFSNRGVFKGKMKEAKAETKGKESSNIAKEEDLTQYPQNISNLIEDYGDITSNVGLSTVKKYEVFKKYSGKK